MRITKYYVYLWDNHINTNTTMEIQKLTPLRVQIIQCIAACPDEYGISRAHVLAEFHEDDSQKVSAQLHFLKEEGLIFKTPQRGLKVNTDALQCLANEVLSLHGSLVNCINFANSMKKGRDKTYIYLFSSKKHGLKDEQIKVKAPTLEEAEDKFKAAISEAGIIFDDIIVAADIEVR